MTSPFKGITLLRNLLLLFAVGSLGVLLVRELGGRQQPAPQEELSGPAVVVFYFSQGKDCTVCNNIEAYTRETLDTHFAAALASGAVVWRSLDLDAPQHQHYLRDFELYTKSVVIAELRDGEVIRYKNLEAVWDHVYDKAIFVDYIRTELEAFLEPQP